MKKMLGLVFISVTSFYSCNEKPPLHPHLLLDNSTIMNNDLSSPVKTETATFANGCFWCTEAIFEELDGVISAVSGYTGGRTEKPTDKQVGTGGTGHAQAPLNCCDPLKIRFDEMLRVLCKTPY